ncbi:MAG: bifunctional pyr operon transcriptional regulator/uracil phosphoribosyltransferase, partial [Actinobacteria bacterium]|nr:bifunctional pyr operon transcriptional regulator/uracil phosphoribosyltransferase [Actinomycetota bacterium]
DFVGKNIPTNLSERVRVRLTESDQDQSVVIEQ